MTWVPSWQAPFLTSPLQPMSTLGAHGRALAPHDHFCRPERPGGQANRGGRKHLAFVVARFDARGFVADAPGPNNHDL